jgi:hypothetical protein
MNRLRFFATLFGAVLAPVYARLPSKLATPVPKPKTALDYMTDVDPNRSLMDGSPFLGKGQTGMSTSIAAHLYYPQRNALMEVLRSDKRADGELRTTIPLITKRVTGPPYSA